MVLFEFKEHQRFYIQEKGHKVSPTLLLDTKEFRYLVHNDDVGKVSPSQYGDKMFVLTDQPRIIRVEAGSGVYIGYLRYPHKVLRYDITTFGVPYTWWEDAITFEHDMREMWDMAGIYDHRGKAKNHPVVAIRELYESGLLIEDNYTNPTVVFSRCDPKYLIENIADSKGGYQLFIKTKDGEIDVTGIKGTLDKFHKDGSDIEWLAARDHKENVTFFLTDKTTPAKDIIFKYLPDANVTFIEIDPVEFAKDIKSRTKEQLFDSSYSWNKYVAHLLPEDIKGNTLLFTMNGDVVTSGNTSYTNANSFNSIITYYVINGVKQDVFKDEELSEYINAQLAIYNDLEYLEG